MRLKICILVILVFALTLFAFSCADDEVPADKTETTAETASQESETTAKEETTQTEKQTEPETEPEPETLPENYVEPSEFADAENLFSAADGSFEDAKSEFDTNWTAFGGGSSDIDKKTVHSGKASFMVEWRDNEWTTPSINLHPYIAEKGAGVYKLSFYFKLEGNLTDGQTVTFGTCIRGGSADDVNSFIKDNNGNIYGRLDNGTITHGNEWQYIERLIYIEEGDLDGEDHSWQFCFDMFTVDAEIIYIDDCVLKKEEINMNVEATAPVSVKAWVADEIVLLSENKYSDPFGEVQLDVIFKKAGTLIKVPAFWDGGNVWRVRFVLPETGNWEYETVSSHSDAGLTGTGKITCAEYDGELDIYKHGFIKTEPGKRYFMYADGTPFFYLGDTHWNMPAEEFDRAGEHAADTGAKSHFCYIVDKGVEQGFTVYQSEPIGASYDLSNGLTEADIRGFHALDEKFAYIANAGLVHANAQLFFASELFNKNASYPDEYLEKLVRYWVARYGAYPVLWTLAQECDDDFYYDRGDQKVFDAANNPWKKVLAYITKYDPYKSPATAHMEYASMDSVGGVNASRSAFGSLSGHSWYGVQWSPRLDGQLDFALPRDFYENGTGKPYVNYEGRYDYLWTKHFGARVQGWTAYLNGMMGYGYGAIDIWLYKSTYNTDVSSNDGVNEITIADKAVHWGESVNFETAWQMGYMKAFFANYEWFRLTPRFDDKNWVEASGGTIYSLATMDNDLYIAYLYNRNSSGITLNGLDQNAEYEFFWYDPRSGEYGEKKAIPAGSSSYKTESKPSREDWVAVLQKAK